MTATGPLECAGPPATTGKWGLIPRIGTHWNHAFSGSAGTTQGAVEPELEGASLTGRRAEYQTERPFKSSGGCMTAYCASQTECSDHCQQEAYQYMIAIGVYMLLSSGE